MGEVHYLDESLVQWRAHGGNLSNERRGRDTASTRQAYLQKLKLHQRIRLQWQRDLATAGRLGLLQSSEATDYRKKILAESERVRLFRYSLGHFSWGHWIRSACGYCRLGGNHWELWHFLNLRLYAARRESYWQGHFSR